MLLLSDVRQFPRLRATEERQPGWVYATAHQVQHLLCLNQLRQHPKQLALVPGRRAQRQPDEPRGKGKITFFLKHLQQTLTEKNYCGSKRNTILFPSFRTTYARVRNAYTHVVHSFPTSRKGAALLPCNPQPRSVRRHATHRAPIFFGTYLLPKHDAYKVGLEHVLRSSASIQNDAETSRRAHRGHESETSQQKKKKKSQGNTQNENVISMPHSCLRGADTGDTIKKTNQT